MTYSNPGIRFDAATFEPFKVMSLTHTLSEHPLLQLDKLVELGDRLARKGAVRYHNDSASADTNFTTAPETHKAAFSPEETLRKMSEAKAWLALHNVQQDPLYRGLVDEVLDHVRARVELADPGMCHRAGWIFVTSPGAVTPFHMDHEHNFILQIRGTKTLNVWDPSDRTVIPERALELFHGKLSRELVNYRTEIQRRAHVFELEPGMGGYMPQTAPHWVKNGPGVSVTVSCTYYTDETRRRALLYRGNQRLRELGLSPNPVGVSPTRDAVKHLAFAAQQRLKKAIGSTHPDTGVAYAQLPM